MSIDTKAIKDALEAATPGPWRALEDGNQYVETDYMPTAKCVAAARVEGLPRPWNPHAYVAFGMPAEKHEESRFLSADAHLIANAPSWLSQLLADNERLRGEIERVSKVDVRRICENWWAETHCLDHVHLVEDGGYEGSSLDRLATALERALSEGSK